MHQYPFKNLLIKSGNEDFLVTGNAVFEVEDFDDCKEASFVSVELLEAYDPARREYVSSKECLGYISESTLEHLNQDNRLCRLLGYKV